MKQDLTLREIFHNRVPQPLTELTAESLKRDTVRFAVNRWDSIRVGVDKILRRNIPAAWQRSMYSKYIRLRYHDPYYAVLHNKNADQCPRCGKSKPPWERVGYVCDKCNELMGGYSITFKSFIQSPSRAGRIWRGNFNGAILGTGAVSRSVNRDMAR